MLVHRCNLNIKCPRESYVLEFIDLLLSEIQLEDVTILNKNQKEKKIYRFAYIQDLSQLFNG
jgi:hypothetical protein